MQVLLIDDHALFRAGLEGLLKRRGVEVTSCSNAAEGVEAIMKVQPNLAMVDLRMPETDGIKTVKILREKNAALPVIILTTSDAASDLRDCLRQNINGYLLKDMDPDELVIAIKKVISGELVVAPELASTLASIIQNKEQKEEQEESESIFSSLSKREMEILSHLTEGQSNKLIARELGISDGTVKLHVKSILKKLGLHSRVEAAVLAATERVFPNHQ